MEIVEICGDDQRRFVEVRQPRKKRVERPNLAVGWIAIAAGDVGLQTHSRLPRPGRNREPGIRGHRPGTDVATAETAKLADHFEVPVPTGGRAKQPRPDRMSEFLIPHAGETCKLVLVA